MEDKILITATQTFVSTLSQNIYNDGKEAFKNLKDELQTFINGDIKDYLIKQVKKYSYTKTFLHGSTPTFFYQYYFPLKLVKFPENEHRLRRISARQIEFLKKEFPGIKILDTGEVSKIFSDGNHISLIGDAGSGKSTLIKHIFFNSIKTKYAIPLLIELRYLNDYKEDLEDYIVNKILESKIVPNKTILNRLLSKGKFIIFLDGYDEIKSSIRDKITRNIFDFTQKHNDNKYILTARPYSNIESLPNFHNYYLKELGDSEIHKFIDQQLFQHRELAEKVQDSIKKGEVEYIESFLTNPLLLSLYILTFQNHPSIPTKKYIFYRRVIEALFSEHDSKSKVGFTRERLTNLSQEEFDEILQRFCFLTFFDNIYDFEKDYLNKQLKTVKEKNKHFTFNNESFIDDLKSSIALWTEDNGIYAFSHRSLQEYFAALFLKNLDETQKRIVYRKLLNELDKPLVFSLTNFLSLSEEMDKYYYNSLLLIPLLEKIYAQLKNKEGEKLLENALKTFFTQIEFRYGGSKKIIRHTLASPTPLSRHFDYCIKSMDFEIYKSIFPSGHRIVRLEKPPSSQKNEILFKSSKKLSRQSKNFIRQALKETNIERKIIKLRKDLKERIDIKKKEINDYDKSNRDIIDLI